MNKKTFIELSTLAGKIAIEHTKLHPITKIPINRGIDQIAKILKGEYSLDIEQICSTAEQYGIYKVIAISFTLLNGQDLIFIRAYGENSTVFLKQLKMQIIPENIDDNIAQNIS